MSTHTVLPADQADRAAQIKAVGGDPNPEQQANAAATPIGDSPAARPPHPADHRGLDAQTRRVGGDPNGSGHVVPDTHKTSAAAPTPPDPTTRCTAPMPHSPGPGTPTPEQATSGTSPKEETPARAPLPPASAKNSAPPMAAALVLGETDDQRGSAIDRPMPTSWALSLADPLLALSADVLDDLERVRIANENRLRQLTRTEADSDGLERGFGLPVDHPDVKRLAALVDGLAASEHQAELNLRRQLRQHPLGPWVKQARGVGEKQAARLIASIGDPYWNTLHNRPRTVSELWAYAGYHVLPAGQVPGDAHRTAASGALTGGNPDHPGTGAQAGPVGVAATRARGQKANWSATAKMRAYLVAVSIVKAGGPYRDVYDAARAKHDGAVHATECKRCAPAGKPAPAGSPLSAGHQHARALRAVAKEVLRDLWREAKRLHELPADQRASDAHSRPVGGDPQT
jgi:hypothetical protein